MSDALAGLDPAPFWAHLGALTRIPRASYEEAEAVAHVEAWAAAHGHATARDAAGNLVVRVAATPGREGAPTVILQGHLDMVCERDPDSPYDPRAGRIHVVRDGDWVHAEGTTLGADNGVAIAAMLALAEDGAAPHGPLELLMTVAEEVGLNGARDLDPDLISGTLLLNLDSEEDASVTVGCAGGADVVVRFGAPRAAAEGALTRVAVSGARGGHSGGDIALGRANAIKALGRALGAAPGLRIVGFEGGTSRNAIPRDASALVLADAAQRAAIEQEAARIADAYRTTDPGVRIALAPADPAATAWSAADSTRFLDLVAAIPVGPLGMSAAFPGTVETSSSVGVAAPDGNGSIELHSLSRSANDALLDDVLGAIAGAARLAGAECEISGVYPGWRPDLDAPLLAAAIAAHTRLFGAAPAVTLTHGGLEAAIIAAKRPGMDALSFGPWIEGPHAPGERLNVPSAGRFMRLLAGLLDGLSR